MTNQYLGYILPRGTSWDGIIIILDQMLGLRVKISDIIGVFMKTTGSAVCVRTLTVSDTGTGNTLRVFYPRGLTDPYWHTKGRRDSL